MSASGPITPSRRSDHSYGMPTCSSSPQEPYQSFDHFDDNDIPLLNAFIKLKITDEKGNLTPEYVNHPLPLPNDSFFKTISELQNTVICLPNNKTLILNKILDHLGEKRTFVGSVVTKKVLTLEYFYDVLRSLDISDPEHLIPESIQREFNTPPADIDIRMIVQREGAAWVDEVHKGFIEWFRNEISTFESVWTKNITKWNRNGECTTAGLYIKLPGVDITLASKLSAPYLIRGQSLEIAPNGANPIQSHCHHLQAIIDCLLKRIVPYKAVNEQGLIRILDYIKNGYLIFDEDIWNQLAEMNQFDNFDLMVHVHLCDLMKICDRSHPSKHPYGLFFLALNGTSLFKSRTVTPDLLKDQIQPLWNLISIDHLPPYMMLSGLHRLFKGENHQIPMSLLELSAFVFDILKPDSPIQSKLVPGNSMLSYQLTFSMDGLPDMHVQLKTSLADAYQNLVHTSNPVVLEVLTILLQVNLPTKRSYIRFQDTSDLEHIILNHLQSENPLLHILNFHLLGVIYMIHKNQTTKVNLLHAALKLFAKKMDIMPFLEHYLDVQLPKGYLALISYLHHQVKGKEFRVWLKMALGRKYGGLPNFVTAFKREVQPQLFHRFIRDAFKEIPLMAFGARIDLIQLFMSEAPEHHPFLFVTFCKTAYELKHKGSPDLLEEHLTVIGEMLIQFFKMANSPIEPTLIRLELIPFIVDSLINQAKFSLASKLLAFGKHGKFKQLFNNQESLLQKKLEEESNSFDQIIDSLKRGTSTLSFAAHEFISLLTLKPQKALDNLTYEAFQELWGCVIHTFEENPKLASAQGMSILQNASIQSLIQVSFPELLLSLMELTLSHSVPTSLIHQFIESYFVQACNSFTSQQMDVFSHLAVRFIKAAWPGKANEAMMYKKFVSESLPAIFDHISHDQMITLLIELHNQNVPIPLNPKTSITIVNALQNYFNNPINELPTFNAVIKITKDFISRSQSLIPLEISEKICHLCFHFEKQEEGKNWIRILFQNPNQIPKHFKSALAPSYASWLKELLRKNDFTSFFKLIPNLRFLDEYEKFLPELITDGIIAAYPEECIHLLLEFPFKHLFRNDMQFWISKVTLIQERLFSHTKSKIKPQELILKLLYEGEIVHSKLWLSLCENAVANMAVSSNRLSSCLMAAELKNLFADNQAIRFECWKIIIESENIVSKKVAQNWLENSKFITAIFLKTSNEERQYYLALFNTLVEKAIKGYNETIPSKIIDAIISARIQIEPCNYDELLVEFLWKMDHKLIDLIFLSLNTNQYLKILNFIFKRLHDTAFLSEKLSKSASDDASVLLFILLDSYERFQEQMGVSSRESIGEWIKATINVFQKEPWIIDFYCTVLKFFKINALSRVKIINCIKKYINYQLELDTPNFTDSLIKVQYLITRTTIKNDEIIPIFHLLTKYPELHKNVSSLSEILIFKWTNLARNLIKSEQYDRSLKIINDSIDFFKEPFLDLETSFKVVLFILSVAEAFLKNSKDVDQYTKCTFRLIHYVSEKVHTTLNSPASSNENQNSFIQHYEALKQIINYLNNTGENYAKIDTKSTIVYRLLYALIISHKSEELLNHRSELMELVYQFFFFSHHSESCLASTHIHLIHATGLKANLKKIGIQDPIIELLFAFKTSFNTEKTHFKINLDRITEHIQYLDELLITMSKSQHPYTLWKLLIILNDNHYIIANLEKTEIFKNILITLTMYPKLCYRDKYIMLLCFKVFLKYISNIQEIDRNIKNPKIQELINRQFFLLLTINYITDIIQKNTSSYEQMMIPAATYILTLANLNVMKNNLDAYTYYTNIIYEHSCPTILQIVHDLKKYCTEVSSFLLNEVEILRYAFQCSQGKDLLDWIDLRIKNGIIPFIFKHILQREMKTSLQSLLINVVKARFANVPLPENVFIEDIILKIVTVINLN